MKIQCFVIILQNPLITSFNSVKMLTKKLPINKKETSLIQLKVHGFAIYILKSVQNKNKLYKKYLKIPNETNEQK